MKVYKVTHPYMRLFPPKIMSERAVIELAVRLTTFGTGSTAGVTIEKALEILRAIGYTITEE